MQTKLHKIILFFLLALVCIPVYSYAASLSISPSSGTYEVGQPFTVRAISTSDAPFNAVSLSLLFPPSIFSIDSISKAGSLLTFWVKEPTLSRSAGTLSLEGVTPGGIKELSGTVVSATLHGIKTGTGSVTFQSGQILANDGQGTDLMDSTRGASYTIIAAKPKVTTTPALQITPALPVVPEVPQPAPTLNPPEIALGSKYGAEAITGTSDYPKIQVLVTFLSTTGAKIFIMGNADEDGSFTLVVPQSLKRGDYAVTARVIKENGLNSKDSNSISISVGSIFSDLGWEVKFAFFLLILVILYLIWRIIQHLRDDWKRRIAVRREAKEAEETLHESMDILKEDIRTKLQGNTTATDIEKLSVVSNDIDNLEQKIEKEISDIEKVEEKP